MRNKNVAPATILLGMLAILALLWTGTTVAGPPTQEGPEAEDAEIQALLDDGFWYQGRLTDGDGDPLANTNVDVTFRIYNSATGGLALDWTAVVVNTDESGLFNEEVDFNNHDLFNGQALYLSLQVSGEASEMTPRQYLRVVPTP